MRPKKKRIAKTAGDGTEFGIGTESIRELTRRLGGTVEFEPQERIFRVVLVLPGGLETSGMI